MPLKDIPKTRVLQVHALVTIQVLKQWRIQDFPEGEPTPNIDVLTYHYRPQRSCGKVMFSHVSVILSRGEGGLYPSMHQRRGSLSRGVSVRGCLCPGVSLSGGSLSMGVLCPGVSLSGGSLSMGVLCPGGSLSRGVSVREIPQTESPPPYGNERVVRILLECILVQQNFCQ